MGGISIATRKRRMSTVFMIKCIPDFVEACLSSPITGSDRQFLQNKENTSASSKNSDEFDSD
jgi:hypothetical protein